MAAEAALRQDAFRRAGGQVTLYDAMPSLGRKFLMAGKSGLNLTHGEDFSTFLTRFGAARENLEPALRAWTPDDIRAWAAELGVETFVGSSGRVFPTEMKAAPLLRAWLRQLRDRGLATRVRHRWIGWTAQGALRFDTPDGQRTVQTPAVVLALGGKSWARLGSDGAWQPWLATKGLTLAPFQPANCGFQVDWSPFFRTRFAGAAIKAVRVSAGDKSLLGEFVISQQGVEGSAIYAVSALLRDELRAQGRATLRLDLHPDRSLERLESDLSKPRGSRSLATHLRRTINFKGVKVALLREFCGDELLASPQRLAAAIKALELPLVAPRPLDQAISTAGGLVFDDLNADFMARNLPGLFCAGEMLDWEAPTGGYLLSACLASGRQAGAAAAQWLLDEGGARRSGSSGPTR